MKDINDKLDSFYETESVEQMYWKDVSFLLFWGMANLRLSEGWHLLQMLDSGVKYSLLMLLQRLSIWPQSLYFVKADQNLRNWWMKQAHLQKSPPLFWRQICCFQTETSNNLGRSDRQLQIYRNIQTCAADWWALNFTNSVSCLSLISEQPWVHWWSWGALVPEKCGRVERRSI